MLGLGSIQSSRWAFDYSSFSESFNCTNKTIGNPSSNYSLWNSPTIGRDGYVYLLPCADTATINGVPNSSLNGVLVVNPGNSNNGTTSYQNTSSQYLEPGTNRDSIPTLSTVRGSNIRFGSKGILAPNGKIYFIGFDQLGVVILTPNGFNSNWQYKTFDQMGATFTTDSKFTGGVLGVDGKIYLIPNNNATARINTSSDTIETGYWTGVVGKRFRNGNTLGNYYAPVDSNGVAVGSPVPNNLYSKSKFRGFKDAIAHPNGKIYIFPYDSQGSSRYIFILNPDNWGSINEIYSDFSLALAIPNPATSNIDSVFGTCENIFLEKLKTGQNANDLKIYATYSGNSAYTTNWNSQYPNAKMLELDPTDNTVGLVGDVNTANGGVGYYGQAAKPGIQFPNGFIVSFLSGLAGSKITNVIITGNDGGATNKFPDSTKNIIGSGTDTSFPYFGNPSSDAGAFAGSCITINNSFGKIIFYGKSGGIAFSVKGFYPRIKYFDSSGDMYKIPSNLSGLATSLWNSYCNKPF